jgi:hypothetical protein
MMDTGLLEKENRKKGEVSHSVVSRQSARWPSGAGTSENTSQVLVGKKGKVLST